MDSAAPPAPLFAAKDGPPAIRGSLLIRAPLSFDENDSPLASDISEEEGFDTATDPEEESIDSALAAAALAASNVGVLRRSSSLLIKAKLTQDDDPDEDEDEDDDFYGVARVPFSSEVPASVDKVDILPADEGDALLESVEKVSGETEGSSQDENLVADDKEATDDAVVAGAVGGDEEHAVAVDEEDKDDSLIGEPEEPVVELKRAEESSQVAEVEKDGEVKSHPTDGNIDSTQNINHASLAHSLEQEFVESSPHIEMAEGSTRKLGQSSIIGNAVAVAQEDKDGSLIEEPEEPVVELKRAEESSQIAEVEKDGEVKSDATGGNSDSTQNINHASLAHSLEQEFVGSYSPHIEMAEGSTRKLDQSSIVGNAKGGALSTGSPEIVDGEATRNSADVANDIQADKEQKVELDQIANDSKSNDSDYVPWFVSDGDNSISVLDRLSPFIIAEGSKVREIDEGRFGTSSVCDEGNSQLPISVSELELTKVENLDDHEKSLDQENSRKKDEKLVSGGPVAVMASPEEPKVMIKELDLGSSSNSRHSSFDSSKDVVDQLILDLEEEVVIDDEGEHKQMIDSDALVALLKAATGSSTDGSINVTYEDANKIFMVDRPAGFGSGIPSLKPAPACPPRKNILDPADLAVTAKSDNHMTEEQKKLHDKVELIRVKFLRLVHRLGYSPEDTMVAQVLYRLSLAEGIRIGRQPSQSFNLDSLKEKALQLEQCGKEDFDFSCNILVLGKSGVGKSATVNSIFGENKSQTNAFEPATFSVKEIVGIVDGIKIRVIDTPGLRVSGMDQISCRRILTSIKKYTKRFPPDIVLYVDRMDMLTRDQNDLPLLRTITSILGPSIWLNAVIALTHASSAPPEGPSGSPLSYEVFVAQRSYVVQQSIKLAAGDMRLLNPVVLVENHPSCRKNSEGHRVLPNGLTWRPQLLLHCYSSKILSEANSVLKLQDPSPRNLFGFRFRSPPLPFLLYSLLQSRAHPKLPSDQSGDYGDSDMDLDDLSDTDQDNEEDEYDQLPPFKPLRRSQIAKLTKEQRRAYFDEYDYRVKLLQKKQWKDELRRLKEMKNSLKVTQDDFVHADMAEDFGQDNLPATIPVPLPDMVLPPSFDCDAPAYRYRFLEPTSGFLARPVLDTHGWDHDCGYDGVSLEGNLAMVGQFPAVLSAQVTKSKKEFNIHLDSSVSAKHGENGSSLAGFDIQRIGEQLAYILRCETKLRTMRKNRTTGGISINFIGKTVATGLKLEDQLFIGKQVGLVASTAAVRAKGDTAYGANLEAHFRGKDYPISQKFLSTLALSLNSFHGNMALSGNMQSQFSIGRNSEMAVRVGLTSKMTGQITVKASTSEQLQLALVGILPIAISIIRSLMPGESSSY
ncbi:hypothetical protein Cni_G20959 [Canna indica]|uniref:AIG1-type G domain-containing protein n=1 Tax=Canna indica TaxID=4628 RepID=A0AAQ3QI80_9LILI|nr:hypothetical protein Cni_G20959 [Canna indica]